MIHLEALLGTDESISHSMQETRGREVGRCVGQPARAQPGILVRRPAQEGHLVVVESSRSELPWGKSRKRRAKHPYKGIIIMGRGKFLQCRGPAFLPVKKVETSALRETLSLRERPSKDSKKGARGEHDEVASSRAVRHYRVVDVP